MGKVRDLEGVNRLGDLQSIDPDMVIICTEGFLADVESRLEIPEEMIRNVMFYGVLKPILVRRNGDTLEVVDGRRRVMAARLANARLRERGEEIIRVPFVLKSGADELLAGMMISANEMRKDYDPMAKAINALKLKEKHGKSSEQIGLDFGVSAATVDRWLALNNLVPEVQRAISNKEITVIAGEALSTVDRDKQVQKMKEIIKSGGGKSPTGKQIKDSVKTGKPIEKTPRPRPTKEIRARLEELRPGLGASSVTFEGKFNEGFFAALEWVLNEKAEEATKEAPVEATGEEPKEAPVDMAGETALADWATKAAEGPTEEAGV